MTDIKAGVYTVGEIFTKVGFDFNKKAGAEYLQGGPDYRRVQVGGLGFDSLDQKIFIPPTADKLEITLDGQVVESFDVTLDKEQKSERQYSFEVAVDASDSRVSE